MKKLDYIDALRGYAILLVVMVHTCQYEGFNVPGFLEKIFVSGERGVQLFYVASAFTLFLSFHGRANKENGPVRNFFIRRIFRIAPMYYLGIIFYLFLYGLGPRHFLGDATRISFFNILSNITFTHGFNPYWINSVVPGGWSIAVEMMFYVMVPFLCKIITNINRAFNFFLISMALRFLLNWFLVKHPFISHETLWNHFVFYYFPNQLPVFALGIIMFYCIMDQNGETKISGLSLIIFASIILFQVVSYFQLITLDHVVVAFAFVLIGIGLSRYSPILIVNPIINFIGKLSYSMYLVHFAVLYVFKYNHLLDFFENGIANYCIRFFVVVLFSTVISYILYHLVEIPFQRIGKNMILKLEGKQKAELRTIPRV